MASRKVQVWRCKTNSGTNVDFISDINQKDWYHCHCLTIGGTWGVQDVNITPLNLQAILKDGWDEIDCNDLHPGDIVVWYDQQGQIEHSAWVAQSAIIQGTLDGSKCYLVTKNGEQPLDVQSLQDLIKIYKGARKCYRIKKE